MLNYNLLKTIDFFPDPIVVVNMEHQVIAWNQAMVYLTGLSVEAAKALTLDQRDHIWLADLVINPQFKTEYEYELYEKNGQFYVLDYVFAGDINNQQQFCLQAAPIFDDNGEMVGAIEIIRDSSFYIDANQTAKAAQQQLEAAYQQVTAVEEELRQQFDELQYTTAIQQESERRFRTMLESVQLVTLIVDLKSNITFINDYALDLTGWRREEVLGKPYLDRFFPAKYRKRVNQWTMEAMQPTETIKHGFAPLQTQNGDYRYIDWNSTQLFDGNGNLEGLAVIGSNVTERVQAEEELRRQLNYTNTMIDNLNEMFYTFDLDMRCTFINKKSQQILGYAPEQLIGTLFNSSQVASEDFEWIQAETRRRLTSGEPASYVLPWIHRDGHKIYLKINSTALRDDGRIVGGMVLADDITEDIRNSEALRTSEQNLRRVTDHMLDLIGEVDIEGNLIYISPSHAKLLGYTDEEMRAMTFKQLVHPDDLASVLTARKGIMNTGKAFTSEQRVRRTDGTYVWTETLGNAVKTDGKVVGVILCTRDITSRKQLEQELRYLNIHDVLTALYNRTYFEEQMEHWGTKDDAVGIMVCDLDGLKLVNDTLGHDAGDQLLKKTGEILSSCFGESSIVARVGGDEFAVISPRTDLALLEQAAKHIRSLVADYNHFNPQLPLSISIGTAVRKCPNMPLQDVYKEADNNMYRFKLNNSKSARNAVVQTMMKALEARDFITEGHGERMQQLAIRLGKALGLPINTINTLSLLAQFHDIGKVGIPDRILFKTAPLNDAEYSEMKRHCEIGHRIALASQELTSLADLILKHHEWWDGNGYPLGISGEQIPLECRILALADAYDAMTSERPYGKAISREEALAEICRCAGTQFDPLLAQQFAQVINNWSS